MRITFTWSELVTEAETGGTNIISYNVQWDAGTDGASWSNLAGYSSNYIELEYQSTANVAAGVTYKLRVRARNYWGWGDYSDVL